MDRDMHWSFNLHLIEEARPRFSLCEGSGAMKIKFFGDSAYPDISLFPNTDQQRRWIAAMIEASAAFYRAEPKTCPECKSENYHHHAASGLAPEAWQCVDCGETN